MAGIVNGPGPNDFHFDNGVQKPGLGADEPSEKDRIARLAASEQAQEREAALQRAAGELELESKRIEDKEQDLNAMAEALAAREAALAAREAELLAGSERTPTREARLATERVSES